MTGYPLEPLAHIRQLREEAAATECSAREKALLTARQETLARRKALENYLAWRVQEEDRRYQDILDKELPFKELEDFKAGVAALRDRDNVLLAALEEARVLEKEAEERRDAAVETLKRARKDKEKINESEKIWQDRETREAERREDLEMEEFTDAKSQEMMEENSYD